MNRSPSPICTHKRLCAKCDEYKSVVQGSRATPERFVCADCVGPIKSCKYGHDMTPENTLGDGRCRACHRLRAEKAKQGAPVFKLNWPAPRV